MIKALIFDWHGVLDHGAYRLTSRNTISDHLYQYIVQGRVGARPLLWFLLTILRYCKPAQYVLLKDTLTTIRPFSPLWDQIPRLKQQYQLAILSDIDPIKLSIIRQRIDLSLFDVVAFSAEMKRSKKSPASFLHVAKALDISPGDCLFVDDNREFIGTAQELGFQTYYFRGLSDFLGLLAKV
jgi:FMN phosphatase YigB (HAD superfamily)